MDQAQLEARFTIALNQEDPAALRAVLETIREEGNDVALLDATFLLLDRLREADRSPEEIELIKTVLSERWFDNLRSLLQLTDRWIQTALKIEDFDEMDDAVRYRERFLGTFPKEATMQAFYKAVSLEGKKQYRAALNALDTIPDSLSSAKLASKYLKKAMLQIRLHETNAANDSYQRALVFDPHRQNEIATLVKADLFAANGQYVEALETFESFFVKTNQKLRYLDRYVDWTSALSRFEDTARFVEAYIPKMLASQSKNYRQQFFEAVLRFAQIIHHEEWTMLAAQELRNARKTSLRDDECLVELEALLRTPIEPFDEHASMRQIGMILSKHHVFERLHWIRIDQDKVQLWRFRKDRLYEEPLLVSPFLQDLIQEDDAERILFPEDLTDVVDYVGNQAFGTNNDTVLFVKRQKDPLGSVLILVAGVAERHAKEPLHRAVSLAFSVGSLLAYHGWNHASQMRYIARQDRWFSVHDIAWTTLKNGFLILENETARRLFDAASPLLSFDEAFARVHAAQPLYPDTFLKPSVHSIRFLQENGSQAEYLLDAFPEADCIRLVWTPKPDIMPTGSAVVHSATLADALKKENESVAYGWVRFVHGDPFQAMNDHNRQAITSIWEASFLAAAGDLLSWRRFEADRTGWWIIQSTDKRVIQRIARQANDILRDRLLQECAIGWDGKLLFSVVFSKADRSLEATLDALDIKAEEASKEEYAVFVDRRTWELRERSNAMQVRLEEWMKSDRVMLQYQAFADQAKHAYAFMMASFVDPLDHDERLLEWTIGRHHLATEHAQAVWKKAMKEIERFYRETKRRLAFAVTIDAAFLTIPASARLMTLEAKRRKLPLSLIHVFIRVKSGELPTSLKAEIAYLEAKGFSIGIEFFENLTLSMVASFAKQWMLRPSSSQLAQTFESDRIFVGKNAGERATIVETADTTLTIAELISRFPPTAETTEETPQLP